MSSVMIRVPCIAFRLFDLAQQVGQVTDARGGRVRHLVRRHDLGEVLLARGLAGRRRAGTRHVRRRRRLLRAGVHVAFVVEADVDEILVALGGRRQALEADVVGAAIAREDDDLRVALAPRIERAAQARSPRPRLLRASAGRRESSSELKGCGPAMIAMHEGGTMAIVFGPSAASTCRTESASMQPGHAACPEHRMSSSRSSSLCIRVTRPRLNSPALRSR